MDKSRDRANGGLGLAISDACAAAMARFGCVILCLSILSACAEKGGDSSNDVGLVISNVTIIDAASGVRANMDVSVSDGLITAIRPHDPRRMNTKSAERIFIEGRGRYLIPGLWDAHVHLTYDSALGFETFFPLAIAHGVTSLRDTGGHLDLLAPARAAAKSDPLAPNLYVAGPLIDGPLRIYDGGHPLFPDLSVGVATPQDAERIVAELAAEGVDFIKAYEMLSAEAFEALVKEAEERNLPVAAHSPLAMTATEAARSGAMDMQHLRNLELSCADDVQDLKRERQTLVNESDAPHPGLLRSEIHQAQRPAAISGLTETSCDELIAVLAEEGIFQTPTLTVTRFFVRRRFAEEEWRQTFDMLPESVKESWLKRSAQLADRRPGDADLAYDGWLQGMVAELAKAGVPIMAGTDAPIGFLTPGVSLHEELVELVEAGLTPLQALEAATLSPATFFGLDGEVGSVAVGQRADLVLLNADPLEDIRHISAIEAVIKGGFLIDRQALNALKAQPVRRIKEE